MPVTSSDEGIFSEPEEVFFPTDEQIRAANRKAEVGKATESAINRSEDDEEEVASFDPKHQLDFEGLLYLGYLTDDFVWMNHKFSIRTLTTAEYLEVALIHKRYQGSIGDIRCYTSAIVAACLERVDGKDLPAPLERSTRDNQLSYRYEYITEHWYPWIIDAIYERFQLLEARVEKVLEAMGKASG